MFCRCTKSFTETSLLDKPKNNSLIVDDIYYTGYTLDKIKNIKDSETHVWISKKQPTWWNKYKYIKDNEWIIFPWGNINSADKDREIHYQSRY